MLGGFSEAQVQILFGARSHNHDTCPSKALQRTVARVLQSRCPALSSACRQKCDSYRNQVRMGMFLGTAGGKRKRG